MKFSMVKNDDIIHGKVVYVKSDSSFDYVPMQPGDITILIGYLNLTFDSLTRKACQVWGYNSNSMWEIKNLIMPDAQKGDLILEEDYEAGDGVRLVDAGQWHTIYDKNKQLVCVCEDVSKQGDESVEFAEGITVSLSCGTICAIWLSNFEEV